MSPMTVTTRTVAPVHRMLMCNYTFRNGGQVEGMYNKLLDLSDRFRDEMGDITDNVSLATALETAWEDLPSKTGTPLHRSPGVHHSACQYQSVCCQGGASNRCPSLLRGGCRSPGGAAAARLALGKSGAIACLLRMLALLCTNQVDTQCAARNAWKCSDMLSRPSCQNTNVETCVSGARRVVRSMMRRSLQMPSSCGSCP